MNFAPLICFTQQEVKVIQWAMSPFRVLTESDVTWSNPEAEPSDELESDRYNRVMNRTATHLHLKHLMELLTCLLKLRDALRLDAATWSERADSVDEGPPGAIYRGLVMRPREAFHRLSVTRQDQVDRCEEALGLCEQAVAVMTKLDRECAALSGGDDIPF